MFPFHWIEGDTVTMSVTTTTGTTALTRVPNGGRLQLRFYNDGAVAVFVRKQIAGAATTALVTDLPIAPGATEVLTVNNSAASPLTGIAAITGSSTATLYVTVGDGL